MFIRKDFTIPTSQEFATAQLADIELRQLYYWIVQKQCFSADSLAPVSGHIKAFDQLFGDISFYDSVLLIRRSDDPEKELIMVLRSLTERIIRFFHEGL